MGPSAPGGVEPKRRPNRAAVASLVPVTFVAALLLADCMAPPALGATPVVETVGADLVAGDSTGEEPGAPAPLRPEAPVQPRPELLLLGGYTSLPLDDDVVGRTVAVIEETLAEGAGQLPDHVAAEGLDLAEVCGGAVAVIEVLEARSQVVAGRNIWLRARYRCRQQAAATDGAPTGDGATEPLSGELWAIVYWNLQGKPLLTDVGFLSAGPERQ